MVHKWRYLWNEAIKHKPYKESPQDAFHADKCHKSCTEEHHCQHEDELHHAIAVAAEEPSPDTWECVHDYSSKYHYFYKHPHPEHVGHITLVQAAYHGQYQQGECVGDCRAAYRDAHRPLPCDTVTLCYWVGHECVRGIHAGQEY